MEAREFQFSDKDFGFIAQLIGQHSGIVLAENKRDMVYGRLVKRLRELKLASFHDYCALLQTDAGAEELVNFTNALTTNHTGFFREPHHFYHLAEVTRALAAKQSRIRLWSAAASIGAEAYSMAMTIADAVPNLSAIDLKILATDIDTNVIRRAEAGLYPASMAQPIPTDKRGRYTRALSKDEWQVHPRLQEMIAFKTLNLLEGWPMQGKFDIIFCRNVVIYFDKPTQARLFNRFADILHPDGWLYIGHSESLFNVCDRFRLTGKTIYQKVR